MLRIDNIKLNEQMICFDEYKRGNVWIRNDTGSTY